MIIELSILGLETFKAGPDMQYKSITDVSGLKGDRARFVVLPQDGDAFEIDAPLGSVVVRGKATIDG